MPLGQISACATHHHTGPHLAYARDCQDMLASEQNTKLCLLEYKRVHEIHMQPSVSEACDKILKPNLSIQEQEERVLGTLD